MMKDEVLQLSKDKVYCSYYARATKILPNHRMVAISYKIPDNFNGEIIRELAPSKELLYGYKYGNITEDEYIKTYSFEVLDRLNPIEIYNKIKGKVILCYCGKDSFCHRRLIIEWLQKNLGSDIIGGEI